ncbi:MAG: hypothetical protein HYX55_02320 [Chloroflexi bacterium]|nr:hypothetical protein [Chloroflexota bacterium]
MPMILPLVAATLTALPIVVLWATAEGAIASIAWIAFIVSTRTYNRRKPQSVRIAMDTMAIVACAAGFFLGGLYWLPAAIAFALADRQDSGRTTAS